MQNPPWLIVPRRHRQRPGLRPGAGPRRVRARADRRRQAPRLHDPAADHRRRLVRAQRADAARALGAVPDRAVHLGAAARGSPSCRKRTRRRRRRRWSTTSTCSSSPCSSRTWRSRSSSACARSSPARRRSRPRSGLGVAVVFVQVLTVPLNNLILRHLLAEGALSWISPALAKVDLSFLAFILFIGTIAAATQVVEMAVERFAPGAVHDARRVPAADRGQLRDPRRLAVHAGARLHASARASSTASARASASAIAIVAMAAIREKLRYSNVPARPARPRHHVHHGGADVDRLHDVLGHPALTGQRQEP